MSLSFKPTISDSYSHLKPVPIFVAKIVIPPKPKALVRKKYAKKVTLAKVRWSNKDLDILFNLRVKGVSYKACARILGRTEKACKEVVRTKYMLPDIKAKQLELAGEL